MASVSSALSCLVLLLVAQAVVGRQICYDDSINGNAPTVPSGTPTNVNLSAVHPELLYANANPVYYYVGYDEIYRTIGEAIEAVPLNNVHRVIIHIDPGYYREKITIPSSKDFITLEGAGRHKTTVVFDGTAGNSNGTYNSSTFAVNAKYFVAREMTFMNDASKAKNGEVGAQAVALRLSGDYALIEECDIISSQDTLYDHQGLHYFNASKIVGNIDFIFGQARSIYKNCDIISNNDKMGALSAQGKSNTTVRPSGFSFVGCYVGGTGTLHLGRPWKDHAIVVFLYSYFDWVVDPEGWTLWNKEPMPSTVYFGEFMNYGPGANLTARLYTQIPTEEEANQYLDISYVNGEEWLVAM